jgi:hypothetical protein
MPQITRLVMLGLVALALVFAYASAGSAATAKPVIRSQAPCAALPCVHFEDNTSIPAIRQFQFSVPSAGTAAVSFTGSLNCYVGGTTPRVVDLVSQIVTTSGANPSLGGASALRHSDVVHEFESPNFTFGEAFNLASTRVIAYGSGGTKNVYFKIAKLRMDTSMECDVYDAAFSVVFVP